MQDLQKDVELELVKHLCGSTRKKTVLYQILKAKDKYELTGAPGIYKALNDYYLNGMPCDQADMVVLSEEDRMVWEAGACLQEPNWKRAGVDSGTMVKFYQAWLKEFVGGANPAFLFRQVADRSTGDPVNKFEIYRG